VVAYAAKKKKQQDDADQKSGFMLRAQGALPARTPNGAASPKIVSSSRASDEFIMMSSFAFNYTKGTLKGRSEKLRLRRAGFPKKRYGGFHDEAQAAGRMIQPWPDRTVFV
jgi:hypothetical protein